MKVAVFDMQPIVPALGGGRMRLLGLYHDLGADVETTYVGSYDWPGEAHRDHRVSATLREIDVPLSDAHFAAAHALSAEMGGRTVIDIAFAAQAHLSPEYVATARRVAAEADAVVFSHPWAWPLVAPVLRPDQLLVYESHNVEGYLRAALFADFPPAARLVADVARLEAALCAAADIVLACSREDADKFRELYGVPHDKLRVVPNGVFASALRPPSPQERSEARMRLGVDDAPLCVFIGSHYGPNLQAARYVIDELAPAFGGVRFALLGGVADGLPRDVPLPQNVVLAGVVSEEVKRAWLHAADIALNPMRSGSGTNIKMFDFLAAGLPVVSTDVGARGIEQPGGEPFATVLHEAFASELRLLLARPERREALARAGRALVEVYYACERISPRLGALLKGATLTKRTRRPFFSVLVPSYERPGHLDELMACFAAQAERDFEVVVIDQSAEPWAGAGRDYGFPLRYVRSDVRGAVKARNFAGFLATGEVLAFTDDDCRPRPGWLQRARAYFSDPGVVGVEGLIVSDHHDDPAFRPVTNVGFEGIGFMTANLIVRASTFHALHGFDLAFDEPHFREDTDFGWRAQRLGRFPFAHDVEVFHPAQPRAIERESSAARDRFFVKDALLMKKHPHRYRELFFAEGHWRQTPGYWEYFLAGAAQLGCDLPAYMAPCIAERMRR